MIYFTAVFGERYRFYFDALDRSWQEFMDGRPLHVFTDQDALASRPHAHKTTYEELWRPYGEWCGENRQRRCVFKFTLLQRLVEMFPGETYCWLDCDQLVTDDLDWHFTDGCISVLKHAHKWPEKNSVGNGLIVSPDQIFGTGMFAVPHWTVEELDRVTREYVRWDDKGCMPDCSCQIILAHAVASKNWSVRLLTENRSYVYNFAEFESPGWHPRPDCPQFAEIELEEGSFWWHDRRIVLWYWVAMTLELQLAQRFPGFQPEVAEKLKGYYA